MTITGHNVSRSEGWGETDSAHWPTNSEFDSCQLTRRSLCNTIEWDIVALITNKVGHSCLSMDAQRIRTAQKEMMSILFVSRLYHRHTWLPNPQVAFPTRESERICEVSEQLHVLFSFSISHTLHCQLILTLNGVQQTENHKKYSRTAIMSLDLSRLTARGAETRDRPCRYFKISTVRTLMMPVDRPQKKRYQNIRNCKLTCQNWHYTAATTIATTSATAIELH